MRPLIKEKLKSLVAASICKFKIHRLYELIRKNITGSHIVIIFYHRIIPKKEEWSLVEGKTPQKFEKEIKYICKYYPPIKLSYFIECLEKNSPLPKKASIITFDDGYKDNFIYAYPILKKYNVPATIFLTTGHIEGNELFWWDRIGYIIYNLKKSKIEFSFNGKQIHLPITTDIEKKRTSHIILKLLKTIPEEKKINIINFLEKKYKIYYPKNLITNMILNWDDIKKMSNDEIEFGAHTVTHPILTNVTIKKAKYEIFHSKKEIEEKIDKQVHSFSYPNGAYSSLIIDLVKQAGYKCAFAVSPNNVIDKKDNIYSLSRIFAVKDFNRFCILISGLYGDIKNFLFNKK